MSIFKLLEKKQNVIYVFVTCVIIVIFSSYHYIRTIKANLVADIKNELKDVTKIKIAQLIESYKDELNDSKLISENKFFLTEFAAQIKSGKITYKTLRDYLAEIKLEHGYEDIFILDKAGKLIATTRQNNFEISEQLLALLSTSQNKPPTFCSDFYYCEKHSELHLEFISKIYVDKKLAGFLVCRKNPDDILKLFYQLAFSKRKTVEIILVKKDGDYFTTVSKISKLSNSPLSIKIPLNKTELAGVEAVKGKKKFFEGKDYKYVDILSYLSPVEGTNWFLVAKIDKSEINQLFFSEIKFLILFLLVFLFGIFFFVFWYYHYSQRNLYRQLYDEEMESRKKNEEFEAILYSIGDAVITADKESKIKNMNHVAEKLTGWTENEAIGLEVQKVFNIINENTRQIAENPVARVLKENTIVGLANHTLLISKDGKEIPIADSGAPVCGDDGNPIGVVLVFRDQTFERDAKRKIEESELRYKQFVHFSNDGIWRFDTTEKIPISIPVEEQIKMIFEHGFLAECNDVYAQMYGFENPEPLIGTKLSQMLIPDDPGNIEYLKNFITNNYRLIKAESVEVDKDGNKKYFLNSLVGIVEGGYLIRAWGTQEDITELKKLHEEKLKSEDRLKRGEIVSKLGNWELNLITKVMHASEGAAKIYGVDKTEIDYEFVKQVPLPEYREILDEALINLIQNNKPYDVEFKIKSADTGQIKDIHSTAIYDKQKNTLFGVIQDITDRVEMTKALEQSENNYKTIFNASNDAIFIDDAATGKMIDINDAVVKMYGYASKEEILAGNIGQLSANIDEYNEMQAQRLIAKCISEGPQSFEWLAKRKDGSTFWIEMHLKKTIVNGKEIILAVGRNIDERKKAEEKILEQLNELRRWQNVMLDREERVIELKNEVNELLGKLGKEKKYHLDTKNT